MLTLEIDESFAAEKEKEGSEVIEGQTGSSGTAENKVEYGDFDSDEDEDSLIREILSTMPQQSPEK